MKNTSKIRILLLIIISISSCREFDIVRVTKVSTDEINFDSNKVKVVGTIIDISPDGISDHGFCYSLNPIPTISENVYSLSQVNQTGTFSANLFNLLPYQTYNLRAYAKSGSSIVYGKIMILNTNPVGLSVSIYPPVIINSGLIKVSGSIGKIGALSILEYGHCYSKSPSPTINDERTTFSNLNIDTNFTSNLQGLTLKTRYYIRAYAKLSGNHTLYSTQDSITIPDLIVTTDTFSIVISGTATLQGTIQDKGVNPINEYGFCWSVNTSFPSVNDNKLLNTPPANIGSYFKDLSGITIGTTYYYRAYASDGSTIRYGIVKKIIN